MTEAARFLEQTTFGANINDIDTLVSIRILHHDCIVLIPVLYSLGYTLAFLGCTTSFSLRIKFLTKNILFIFYPLLLLLGFHLQQHGIFFTRL